jgi:hypothetical protein
MTSTVTATVPPDQGDLVLDTLLTLYQAHAEALNVATLVYLDDRVSLAPVVEHRDDLTAVEALIDLVGWHFGARTTAVELVGDPGLVREVVFASLVDAAHTLSQEMARYEEGRCELPALNAAARSVSALFRVFSRLENTSS